jgi:hypothetical protein
MTADPRSGGPVAGDDGGPAGHRAWDDLAVAEDHDGWAASSRVFPRPVAAPSIMVLSG